MNKLKKICIVTGSRAEYGLLRWVMSGILQSPKMKLQILATGMHLSPEFGLTYREIEKDGFLINRKLEMLLSADTSSAISKSMGLAMIGFADAINELKPDLLLLLGDRYEIFAAAAAAMIARVPIAHLHGGETTEGAFDEAIRHSITKMSHLHFTAADKYRDRIIQLGENPNNVFVVGGLGIDSILKLELMNRDQLEKELDFKLGHKNLLVTFHPPTLEKNAGFNQMKNLLAVLDKLRDTHIIFTMPNSDTEGRIFFRLINEFTTQHPHAKAFTSLGQLKYLSSIKQVDGVIGNSSSGLSEVPTFKKATVNIGDRQKGRLKASSVIDCEPSQGQICDAIKKLYSDEFKSELETVTNPYGSGGASDAVVKILEQSMFDDLLKKTFFDLNPK